MDIATDVEFKNNFDRYIQSMIDGNEIIIKKDGKQIGRLVPQGKVMESLTDQLVGIISDKYDLDDEKTEYLKKKFEQKL